MESEEKDDGYSEEEEEEDANKEFLYQPNPLSPHPAIGHHLMMDEEAVALSLESTVGSTMTVGSLIEYSVSHHTPFRQLAANHVAEALRMAVLSVEAYSEQDDVLKVVKVIKKLARDNEMSVKITLMKSIPKVTSFCSEYDSPLVSLKPLIVSEFLPIVLRAIADEDISASVKVRREASRVLKFLLSENFVTTRDIEEKVCSIYKTLLENASTGFGVVSAGNFISRMPPVVGEELTEKLLLPRVVDLCSNKYAKVREACVHFLVDLSCFVDTMITENIIIPHFIKLCQDEVWYVRRTCADTAIMLACTSLLETRKTVLAPAFVDLLHDVDSNVSAAAFQQLGAFITTFSQPLITSIATNINGELTLIYSKDFSFELQSRRSLYIFHDQDKLDVLKYDFDYVKPTFAECDDAQDNESGSDTIKKNVDYDVVVVPTSGVLRSVSSAEQIRKSEGSDNDIDDNNDVDVASSYENQPDIIRSCLSSSAKVHLTTPATKCYSIEMKTEDKYSSFLFWRDPIPEVDEHDVHLMAGKKDIESITEMTTTVHDEGMENLEKQDVEKIFSEVSHQSFSRGGNKTSDLSSEFHHSVHIVKPLYTLDEHAAPQRCVYRSSASVFPKQNISLIPQELLDAYVSMSDASYPEIRKQCAYTFPAVLLTLGPTNWAYLKCLYVKLANDAEWKLKQIIANSISEIASMIGPESATQDLIPVYNLLVNDSEDVRITALRHLSKFLKLLKPAGRALFLPQLMEFIITDYAWNWRFREDLSQQLAEILDYYTARDCWKFISPVAFSLLMDKVSAVRLKALHLMTNLVRVVSSDVFLLRSTVAELAEQFAHSTQWSRRQTFIFLCSAILKNSVLPDDMFARDILPHLLDLSWDPIPNIRIAVARAVATDIITHRYFNNAQSPHHELLVQVLKRLNIDKDRDVRYFAASSSVPVPSLSFLEDV